MIKIAHRGNTNGRFEFWENEPTYIDLAISKDFDVEVDVWYKDNILWLGHDNPMYGIDFRWFRDRLTHLWVHCKNLEAVFYFKSLSYPINYFWHQNDNVTLTSRGYIWTYPGKMLSSESIAVMPELVEGWNTEGAAGVCSDYIEKYV